MASITDYKVKTVKAEEVDDVELPNLPGWDTIPDRPRTLAQLDSAAGEQLNNATAAITGLGDLAYEDLVTSLQLADAAVTNAKIAVDAIQGAVIAAGAITSTKIQDGSIETPKIATGAVTAGTIASGAITATKIDTGAVTADKIQSGAIIAGKIAAGAIDGITITGSLLRTSSSSTRVQLNNSSNAMEIYSSGTLRAIGYDQGWTYYNSSGSTVADIYAGTTTYGTRSLLITASGSSSGSLYMATGSSGTFAIYNGSQVAAYWTQYEMISAYSINPLFSNLGLGDGTYAWGHLYLNSVGQVDADGSEGFPFPPNSGWSCSKISTGLYQVDIPFGTSSYTVNITVFASLTKSVSVYSRTSSYFRVRITNFAGTLEDNDFFFQLILQ